MPTEMVELRGYIIDSLTLAKVLDLIITRGAEYTVAEIDIGKTQSDPSRVLLEVSSDDPELLQSLLIDLHSQGANRLLAQEATLEPCAQDGVLPEGFYSTTNLPTKVLVSGVPYVLGGSLRDDGPLPDVITDVVQATDRMRELRANVDLAIMLATTLHAIAVGNILSSRVETFCVDINQAVVTKLSDRGSHQTVGIVTDVGLFISELADILSP